MAKNKHIVIGQVGEEIISKYLQKRGFRLIERNFRKKWGEIDIIVSKKHVLHFVEVKAGSRKVPFQKEASERYRPEDHMTFQKKKRLGRVIQTYLIEKDLQDCEWTIDVAIVLIDTEVNRAKVTIIESVLLD